MSSSSIPGWPFTADGGGTLDDLVEIAHNPYYHKYDGNGGDEKRRDVQRKQPEVTELGNEVQDQATLDEEEHGVGNVKTAHPYRPRVGDQKIAHAEEH